MRKSILILLLTCMSFLILTSCGGGDGNGTVPPEVEEFTVYMRLYPIDLDGFGSRCPKTGADLKLRLTVVGDEVFGEANLMNTSMIGTSTEIIGIVEGDLIVLDPFLVNVDWIPPSPEHHLQPSTISFSFISFLGNISDTDQNSEKKEIEVTVSGKVSEVGEEDTIICDGNFKVEALADECLPSSFFPHSDCLAQSISEACNFVTGCAAPLGPGGIHGDFWIGCGNQTDCVCEVLSCNSLVCPFQVNNVISLPGRNLGGGLVGINPDNPDEFTFTCGTGFGP